MPRTAPRPGEIVQIMPGLRRILAPNPSAMTLHGTNSYLLGRREVAVIDPGPGDPAHLRALLGALEPGHRITAILVTHAHADHAALARPLAHETGAPVLAFGDARAGRSARMAALSGGTGGGEGVEASFAPDRCLRDGEELAGEGWVLTALHTPGHMGNHMCFRWNDIVFSGDHVMGWASSLVSPPDGDMTDYMASLERLARLGARRLLPGHGAAVQDPAARIAELAAHRHAREADILAALQAGPADCASLAARIYIDTPARLMGAARRNVLAHLIDLMARGRVHSNAPPGPEALFSLC